MTALLDAPLGTPSLSRRKLPWWGLIVTAVGAVVVTVLLFTLTPIYGRVIFVLVDSIGIVFFIHRYLGHLDLDEPGSPPRPHLRHLT